MKQFIIFVRKEFAHVLRDRKTLLILFVLPIVQIIIFGFALSNEVKNAKIIIIDYARDATSQKIISRIEASNYFEVEKSNLSGKEIEEAFREGIIKMAVVIPAGFDNDLFHHNLGSIQVIADASDPNVATTLTNYITAIIGDYQNEINRNLKVPYRIVSENRMLYNPQLKGAPNFVPGVMALILMLVCVMLTAISIVREKELGTMEILLVSPFNPIFVVLSKAFPYLILSLVNVTSILLLSVFVLDLPINGSLFLLYAESTLFIITCLSIGLLISVRTASQQVAMLISLMGMLLPTILFSGFMFPIENMPVPLQIISNLVPAKWFYIIVKSVMIKGLGIASLWKETLVLIGMTLFFLTVSIKNFKIRLS